MFLWIQKIKSLFSKSIRSMFGRILLSQIALTVVPVAIIGMLSFYASKRIINQQLIRINTAALNQVEENILNLTRNVYQLATLVMLDSDIEKILKSEPSDAVQRIINEGGVGDKISTYTLSFDPLRSHSLILGYDNSVFTARHDRSDVTVSDIMKKSWYYELRGNKNQLVWFEENPCFTNIAKDIPVISFAMNMRGQYSLNSYGIFFFTLEESIFYDLYKNIPDAGGEVYIINSKGKFLSHTNRETIGNTLPSRELDALLSYIPADSKIGLSQNSQYITLIKKVQNLDWYIVYSIPQATNFRIVSHLKGEIFIIASVCIFLSVALAFFLARFFSMPLARLTKRISTYLTSGSQAEKEKPYMSEIDIISSEYETLISRLDNTISQLVKEQNKKRRAEFHALQMQINPHFLYNTLNSIKCLLWTNRVGLIEPTMNALIKLFRQTISLRDELFSLEDEIECVHNYVFIQQIRTNYSIDLHIHISEEIKKCKIPKLLLQPIIENAIFHGLEPKNSDGSITIFCTSSQDVLTIEIEDNGVGMDEATASSLLNAYARTDVHSSSGIGVKNVHERIRLMYGSEYGITIQSRIGSGTQVSLRLPIIFEMGDTNV